jgi:hypothetical protein
MVTRTKFGLIADAVRERGPAGRELEEKGREIAFASE